MKTCPNCHKTIEADDAEFCPECGSRFYQSKVNINKNTPPQNNVPPQGNIPPQSNHVPPQNNVPPYNGMPSQNFSPVYDSYDHTAEFDPKDISDNKVIAMLVYLMGIVGIVLASLVGANNSPYVAFHIRQSLKFTVVDILMSLLALIFCWTVIVPIVAGVMYVVFFVIRIVCFFQICSGQAKEPAIIRDLGFLK